jgi:hypothetical protein
MDYTLNERWGMSSWVTCPTSENTAPFAVPVASSNESPHGIQPFDVAKNNIV